MNEKYTFADYILGVVTRLIAGVSIGVLVGNNYGVNAQKLREYSIRNPSITTTEPARTEEGNLPKLLISTEQAGERR